MPDLLPSEGTYVSVGAAQSYVEGVYGGPVTEQDHEIPLPITTVTKLLGLNPERLALTIINVGSYDCYVMFDNLVSDKRGISLSASGGYVNMTVRDDQMLPIREWWAYAPAGATDLFVLETKRYSLTGPQPIG